MIELILFIIGFVLLIKGADYLVDGSSSLAKKWGIPTLAIGLTIVAFGTSMPELVVNIFAAIKGSGDIAIGNIVGSNIANILLILGISAAIRSLKVHNSTVWKEIPFSFLAAIVLFIFGSTVFLDKAATNTLTRSSGLILLFFFGIFMYYVVEMVRKNHIKPEKMEIKKLSNWKIALMIIGGLAALFIGGKWVVEGAVYLARLMGLSEYLISLTIIAIGTSLPELVTSVVAAYKKEMDLAVGNIVGSNIFNIFWILGLTALIRPIVFPAFAAIDILILLIVTFLLFVFMFIDTKHTLNRWQGVVFLIGYVVYIAYLILR